MPEVRELHQAEPREIAGYRLRGGLGDGGQGSVYLGEAADGTRVAIKVLHTRLLGNDKARRRFLQEGATAERVAGFCTARVYETGFLDGRPYIVSEYIDGPSLQDLGPRNGGALERLAVGTATALAAIHRAGIVHRDFKPSNVLIGPDGPRVIDFGIAKEMDVATTASSVVGTPGYMAPEQIAGENATAASDMFSWASTIAYAATGAPLFGRDSIPAVMHRILNTEPDLSRVQEPLRSVLAACLVKDPAARPSADEVLMRLLGSTNPTEQPIPARQHTRVEPPATRERGPVPRRRGRRAGLVVAGVTAVVIAGVAVGIIFRPSNLPSQTTTNTYGTSVGLPFGPDGADVTAMAVGTYQGGPAVAYADGTSHAIEVWQAETGKRIAWLPGAARSPVLSMAMVTGTGRPTVMWSGADGVVRQWAVGDPKPGAYFKLCDRNARLAVRGSVVAVGCADGSIRSVDPSGRKLPAAVTYVKGPVTALAWDSAGDRLMVGTQIGYVAVGDRGFMVKGAVRALAPMLGGKVAVTTGTTATVYTVPAGTRVRTIPDTIRGMGVTHAGGQEVVVGMAAELNVWNPVSGASLGRLTGPGEGVTDLAVSDGLVAAVVEGRLRVWSLDGQG
ncbi:WD40 repeat domain-containing serine/threonine protein kinase [Nonomuraea sediminis]|uniref:WD40 repeat domain-containing serine/threonine protein kinase n=1 Tax=Nonomuraea sediminis TaxID=2835864 RepID=UPI001BDD5D6C|nr:serine/threonine-protein kinase [Nonomuraea sediminis]